MTLPVPPLATSVSLTSTVTLLVTPVGFASASTPDVIAASGTTVPLSPVATDADCEHCTALGRSADLYAKYGLSIPSCTGHSGIMPDLMTNDDSRLRRG
jgi:hypothetical protein